MTPSKNSVTGNFRTQLKIMRRLILLLLVLILAAAAVLFFFSMDEEVSGRGVVVGLRTYELKSSEQSRITRINFKEGDVVKAGDVLLELDSRDLRQSRERLENAIRELECEIEVKEWGLKLLECDPLPAEYHHTKIALEETEASVANAESELDTYQRLRDKGVVSEIEFHRRELEVLRTKAQLKKLQDDYAKIQNGLADRILEQAKSEIELLRVRLEGKRKELESLTQEEDEFRFVAPEDGTISYIPTKLGSYVEPGQIMVNLAAAGGKKFIAYIDETEIHKIAEKQPVRIESSQYSTYEFGYFRGEVLYIGELPEERGGRMMYPVFILITEEKLPLRIGSTGEAQITVGRSRIITNLTGMD